MFMVLETYWELGERQKEECSTLREQKVPSRGRGRRKTWYTSVALTSVCIMCGARQTNNDTERCKSHRVADPQPGVPCQHRDLPMSQNKPRNCSFSGLDLGGGPQ